MTILIISPKSPPSQCGVGDHAYKLWQTLNSLNFKALLLSHLSNDSENILNKHKIDLNSIQEISEKFKIKQVILEYTPNLWARNGRKLDFELFDILEYFKKNKIDLITFFHEGRYPILSDLRGPIFGPIQLVWAKKIYNLSDKIIFSSEEVKNQFPKIMFSNKKINILPVGSNIHPKSNKIFKQISNEIVISIYAKSHPTKLESWNIKALKIIAKKYSNLNFKVFLIGIENFNNYKNLKSIKNLDLNPTGFLSETDLSTLLTNTDILLSPFKDGVGTRRGSLFSGMAHELKVISNVPKIKSFYNWKDAIYLAKSEKDFFKQFELAIEDIKSNDFHKNTKAYKMYHEYFCFEKNINSLISFINE